MAQIISDYSKCPLCGNVIKEEDEIIMFPPFVQNTKDSFYIFNDSGVHIKCIKLYESKERLFKYLDKIIYKTKPGNRYCDIGGGKIKTIEDYLFIDLLTSDEKEALSNFNFMSIDKQNINKWSNKNIFLKEAKKFIKDNKWDSLTEFNYLEYLIKEIID